MSSTRLNDEINLRILAQAEDCIQGFYVYPFAEIAQRCGLEESLVMERLLAMYKAGVIRRVRQTLLATKLAPGALVAWRLPEDRIEFAFDFLREKDPFTGHVVLRTTEGTPPGYEFRLWTTLKVPVGCSVEEHCRILKNYIGADEFVLLPTKGVFALGVGHIRRRGLAVGERRPDVPVMNRSQITELSSEEWRVLLSIKEQLQEDEFVHSPWEKRAHLLNLSLEQYAQLAHSLDQKKVIGRFASFLEHVKPAQSGEVATAHNGLFHWTVPVGMEQRAGEEVGRHLCMTHCYWRTGGERFGGAQIMGVVHGLDRDLVLAHKAAIDAHLVELGIPVLHTAVFWGQRSEIKPSEISPEVYQQWWKQYASSSC